MTSTRVNAIDVGHGFTWSQGTRSPLAHVNAGPGWDAPTLCGRTLAAATRTSGPTAPGLRACPICARRAARVTS